MPGYIPVALRGDLQTTSTDTESVDGYFDERTRTFSNGEALTYWVADNMVVEGDMILHDDAKAFEAMLDEYEKFLNTGKSSTLESQSVFANPHCVTRVIACLYYTQEGRKWPNGIVYYDDGALNATFSSSQRSTILRAMSDIQRDTDGAVRFVKRNSGDRIVFANNPNSGCYSKLGYVGGAQGVQLSNGCANNLGSVIHELGHAVGLLHEHQRCDRISYITVNTSNLKSKGRSNFERRCSDYTNYGSFDYLSIMMYPYRTSDSSFVNNTNSPMFTIAAGQNLPINPKTGRRLILREVGNLNYLSSRDIAGLKARY